MTHRFLTPEALVVAQSVAIGGAFSLLLVGTNALNPLLPIYRTQLGLSPIVVSLTFVVYVVVMVATLVIMARPPLIRFAPTLMLCGLALALISDVLILLGSAGAILLGRGAAGAALGLATGAASALVVAGVGDRGRGLAATGNLVGAVLGAGLAQVAVDVIPETAPSVVYTIHAIAIAGTFMLALALLLANRRFNRGALRPSSGSPRAFRVTRREIRYAVIGSISWSALSLAVVYSATLFHELRQPLAQTFGATLMLVASAAAQVCSHSLAPRLPAMSGLGLLALGSFALIGGSVFGIAALAVTGLVALGVGTGLAYRTCLVAMTRGVDAGRQGALASFYSATTYGGAAVVVLLVGTIGGAMDTVTAILAAFAIVGTIAGMAYPWSPRLRDTAAV